MTERRGILPIFVRRVTYFFENFRFFENFDKSLKTSEIDSAKHSPWNGAKHSPWNSALGGPSGKPGVKTAWCEALSLEFGPGRPFGKSQGSKRQRSLWSLVEEKTDIK